MNIVVALVVVWKRKGKMTTLISEQSESND